MHTVTVDIKSQKLFLGFIWWNVDSEISYSHQYCSLSNGNEIFNFNDFGTLSPITAKKYELTMGHANLDYLPRYDLFFLHYNGSISSQFENQLVCEMEIKYNKL